VTGAGPIGLLAALRLSVRELQVHVLDRAETGLKPELVRALGATYPTGSVRALEFEPDIIVECTGVGPVIADSIQKVGAAGIVCLGSRSRRYRYGSRRRHRGRQLCLRTV
jgi:2-polyprenyl-6-methoxyphenol hydroxylase-like FAD-dependent oxidoreductase